MLPRGTLRPPTRTTGVTRGESPLHVAQPVGQVGPIRREPGLALGGYGLEVVEQLPIPLRGAKVHER